MERSEPPVPAIGSLAFRNNQEHRPISLSPIQSDARVQLKVPTNLSDLRKFWDLLSVDVTVWLKESIQHGFVVQVRSDNGLNLRVEYKHVNLDVREGYSESRPLCLIRTNDANRHFMGLDNGKLERYGLGRFDYAYVQIELNRFAVNGTATRTFLLSLLSSSLTLWTR